ncbi:thioredoxin domain-containing protein [Consotaella salsifontis]|uniref:Spermatogenesis-associated protein 20-like TRX domain-containing protein n=1 Tax=Consotaella salsifontis TaxID=1365950 RepID=A0A1T4T5L9_9HYPH|nr:thioredoxin domain-containing protein [Consotaella salsifontis]SKA35468.1 hypothetical protein SAMN05428963_11931 [Consotaella salsifontis]
MAQPEGNQLANALSPYLQQHKDNPVHWREWSKAALDEAKARDCPILLSVGYAACHWCHVMAHESFEDEEIAALMNRHFVNIKVDREERPDLDHLYMAALHAMGEQGGWPMTMFLTPDGEPFWGGTYFPKRSGFGRPGFADVLVSIDKAWREQRDEILKTGGAIKDHLGTALASGSGPAGVPDDLIARLAPRIAEALDMERGGLRGAPKFPNAPYLEVVARSAFPDGPRDHQTGFLLTLTALCNGGIYDHVGGGLHRYSTDDRWLVPHFEKMLYDNAQFLRHLVWGWRATGRNLFRRRIDETIGWLKREMLNEGRAFAASLDADSRDAEDHLEEGAFYVWREAEIRSLLGARADDFIRAYGVTKRGNWEGKSILHRLHPEGGGEEAFTLELGTLRVAREARARPGRDDKVLADWNGLMIRALAEVASALDHADALVLAEDAYAFVMDQMVSDGRLLHAWRQGRASGLALTTDYGAMIAAAVSLFAVTGQAAYLEDAEKLATSLERWHGDGEGSHFLTAHDASDIIVRPRGDHDDAIPGGTALVVEALGMLAQAMGSPSAHERARRAGEAAAGRIASSPGAGPAIVSALDRLAHASELAVIGSPADEGYLEMVSQANRWLDLNRVDMRIADPKNLPDGAPLAAMRVDRQPAALFCFDRACMAPVHTADDLEELFSRASAWRAPEVS